MKNKKLKKIMGWVILSVLFICLTSIGFYFDEKHTTYMNIGSSLLAGFLTLISICIILLIILFGAHLITDE